MATVTKPAAKSGGGDKPKIALKVSVIGVRNNCKIKVELMQGRMPLSGEEVLLFVGTTSDPRRAFIIDGGADYKLKTGALGDVSSKAFDFSDKGIYPPDETTQVTVVYLRLNDPDKGIYTESAMLPLPETADASKGIKKIKRMKVIYEGRELADGQCTETFENKARVRIDTFDSTGKPSQENVFISEGENFTLEDGNGNILRAAPGTSPAFARDVKQFTLKTPDTPVKGLLFMEMSLNCGNVLERRFTFLHLDSREAITIVFHLL